MPAKLYRRKTSWPRAGRFNQYGDYPPSHPSFWAKSAILLALAEEDPDRFERHLKEYLPSPLGGLHDLEELKNAIEYAAQQGKDFIAYVEATRLPNSPLLKLEPLLSLLKAWELENSYLLPLAKAAIGQRDADGVKEELRFFAYTWPRSFEPFHEVEPGEKAGQVDGLDLEAPKPRKASLQKGPVRGWKPAPGQDVGNFPRIKNPHKLARMVALHKLGRSYLEIAKLATGRDDLLDGDSIVRKTGRDIKLFLSIANGKDDPRPTGVPSHGPHPPGKLTDLENKLVSWAQKRRNFSLRELLRSGPKELRRKDAAVRVLEGLVQKGYLQKTHGDLYQAIPPPPAWLYRLQGRP